MWNAQALFAAEPRRQTRKFSMATRILSTLDFCVFSETHSTYGRYVALAHKYRQEFVWFYVHGDRTQKGVCLVVRKRFLEQFGNPFWVNFELNFGPLGSYFGDENL